MTYLQTKAWKARKKAEGFCHNCCKRPAGVGRGATKTKCGECAEQARQYERNREAVPEPQEPVARVNRLLELAERSRRTQVSL